MWERTHPGSGSIGGLCFFRAHWQTNTTYPRPWADEKKKKP